MIKKSFRNIKLESWTNPKNGKVYFVVTGDFLFLGIRRSLKEAWNFYQKVDSWYRWEDK